MDSTLFFCCRFPIRFGGGGHPHSGSLSGYDSRPAMTFVFFLRESFRFYRVFTEFLGDRPQVLRHQVVPGLRAVQPPEWVVNRKFLFSFSLSLSLHNLFSYKKPIDFGTDAQSKSPSWPFWVDEVRSVRLAWVSLDFDWFHIKRYDFY